MNGIYFPLWSNIDFFENKSKQPDLIKRIKLSTLMYDKLYFDSGIYSLTCSENGSFSSISPYQGENPLPEESIKKTCIMGKNEETGQTFTIIPPGESRHFAESFEHVMHELGLYDENFIEFQTKELNDEGERLLNEAINKTEGYKEFIEGPTYFKESILKNFHTSLLMSYGVAPMMVDNIHQSVLTNMDINHLNLDLSLEVLNRVNKLLKCRIPDFSSMETQEILDLRKDPLFKKFRTKLFDINNSLTKKDISKLNGSDIDSLFMDEYISEMKEFAPSKKEVVVNGALGVAGLFPVVGTIASVASLAYTGKALKTVHDYNSSWLAFVMQY